MMKKVLVTFPTSPSAPLLHKGVVEFSWKLLHMESRYHLTLMLPSHTPFENNLHHIVNDFVEGGYHYWLSVDADNPPQCNPLDWIERDRDIIGFPTPVWHCTGKEKLGERTFYYNGYDYVPEDDAYREHKHSGEPS